MVLHRLGLVLIGIVGLAALALVAEPADAQTSLRFVNQPLDISAATPFVPVVSVGAYDGSGNLVTSSTTITLTLRQGTPQSNSLAPATLVNAAGQNAVGANPTATTSGGIARFPGMAVTDPSPTTGCPCTFFIRATSGSLQVDSHPFIVVAKGAPWGQVNRHGTHIGQAAGTADFSTTSMTTSLPSALPNRFVNSMPLLVDMDQDGDLDIVAVEEMTGSPGQSPTLAVFLQAGGTIPATPSCTAAVTNPFVDSTDAVITMAAADLDGNNRPEIAVSTYFLQNAGGTLISNSAQFRVYTFQNPCSLTVYGPVKVDAAGTNAARGGVTAACSPFAAYCSMPAPVIGDVTGDNIPEVLLVYEDWAVGNQYVTGFNFQSGSISRPFFTQVFGTSYAWVAAPLLVEMDPNHDGYEMIIAGDQGNTASTVLLCRPSSSSANCGTSTPASTGVRSMATADMNGDGHPEIVLHGRMTSNAACTTQCVLQVLRTHPSFSSIVAHPDTFFQWNHPALGDVDGDGNADLVNGVYSEYASSVDPTRNGDVRVRGLTAGGAIVDKGTWARQVPGSNVQSRAGPVLLDMTNDLRNNPRPEMAMPIGGNGEANGIADLVTASFAPGPTPSWNIPMTARAMAPIAVGDVTGDCRPDLVTGLSNNQLVVVRGVAASLPGAPTHAMSSSWASPGSGLKAKLYWNAPASDGGLPITHYNVYRAPGNPGGPTGAYVKLAAVWPSGWQGVPTQALPYEDTTVPSYGDWWYQIRAVTCMGESAASSSFRSEVKLPNLPASFTGTVGSVATPAPRVSLSWFAVTANAAKPTGCGDIDSVWVYRSTVSGFTPEVVSPYTNRIADLPGTATTYLDTSVALQTPGDYYYRLVTVNCVGTSATAQFWAEVRPAQAPGAPTTSVNPAMPSVTVTWTVAPNNAATPNGCGQVLQHKLYRAVDQPTGPFVLHATLGATATSHVDLGVVTGSHYYYKLSAENCVGESAQMPAGTGVLADVKAPNTPTTSAVGVTSTRIDVSFTMPNPADPASGGPGVGMQRYEVYWKQGTGVTTSSSKLTPDPLVPPATPIPHTGLAVNTVYCYAVRGIDLNGNLGQLSTEACTFPPDTDAPSATAIAATPDGPTRVQLNWAAAADNVGILRYEVYWKVGPGVTTASNRITPDPSGATLSLSHTGRTPGSQYCYRIQAVDAALNIGPLSPESCATTDNPSALPPAFVIPALHASVEDQGLVTVAGFATGIEAGAPHPSDVRVAFELSVVGNPGLFAGGQAPTISPSAFQAAPWSGLLQYRAGPDQCGTARVEVVLKDNAGNTGRMDTSPPQMLDIQVACVNDAPVWTPGPLTYDLGLGAAPVSGLWATNMAAGPAGALDETTGASRQGLRFEVTVTNPGLFDSLPVVAPMAPASFEFSPAGTLAFAVKGIYGAASADVCLVDSGDTANGGVNRSCQTLIVRVLPPPTAQPDCYRTNGPLRIAAPGVAGNDAAPGGKPPTVRLEAAPSRAAAFVLRPDGSFDYTARIGFSGTDVFTYRAQSGAFLSEPVQVCIHVEPSGIPVAPTARIAYSPAKPTAGQSVSFWDVSTDPDGAITSVEWTFEGLGSATGPASQQVFRTPGTYLVTLLVRDDTGLTDTDSVNVVVGAAPAPTPPAATPPAAPVPQPPPPIATPEQQAPAPAPRTGAFQAFPEGLSLRVQADDGGAITYRWDFGDGTVVTGGPNHDHEYRQAGTYKVRVEVVTATGVASTEQEVEVLAPIVAEQSATDDADALAPATEPTGIGLSTIAWGGLGMAGALAAVGLGVLLARRRKA